MVVANHHLDKSIIISISRHEAYISELIIEMGAMQACVQQSCRSWICFCIHFFSFLADPSENSLFEKDSPCVVLAVKHYRFIVLNVQTWATDSFFVDCKSHVKLLHTMSVDTSKALLLLLLAAGK